jgi:hypothetical protein
MPNYTLSTLTETNLTSIWKLAMRGNPNLTSRTIAGAAGNLAFENLVECAVTEDLPGRSTSEAAALWRAFPALVFLSRPETNLPVVGSRRCRSARLACCGFFLSPFAVRQCGVDLGDAAVAVAVAAEVEAEAGAGADDWGSNVPEEPSVSSQVLYRHMQGCCVYIELCLVLIEHTCIVQW